MKASSWKALEALGASSSARCHWKRHLGEDWDACAPWESEGHLRRVDSAQDAFGHVRAVLLFLPPGNLGNYPCLFRSLSARPDSTVLFPATRIPLPASRSRRSSDVSGVRAAIHAGNGLTWDQVNVKVTAGRTILLKAPGQEGKYRFPPNSQLQEDHPIGMLMRLAVDGQWRNPSLADAEYYRVSKAFLRLRQLLQSLAPPPGQPFKKVRGAFVPVFRIRLHPDLLAGVDRDSGTPIRRRGSN